MDDGNESLRHKSYLKFEVMPDDDPDIETPTAVDPDTAPTQPMSATVPETVEPTAAKPSFDRTRLRQRKGRE